MTNRFYLLLERRQKLDALLNLARSRPKAKPLEIAHLLARKRSLGERLSRLMRQPGARARMAEG